MILGFKFKLAITIYDVSFNSLLSYSIFFNRIEMAEIYQWQSNSSTYIFITTLVKLAKKYIFGKICLVKFFSKTNHFNNLLRNLRQKYEYVLLLFCGGLSLIEFCGSPGHEPRGLPPKSGPAYKNKLSYIKVCV